MTPMLVWRKLFWVAGAAATVYFVLAFRHGLAQSDDGEYRLVNFKEVVRSKIAGRPRWSPDGEWLYYDDHDKDGDFKIYRVRPDGSSRECVTCDRPEVPKQSGAGNFHPSGRFMVFAAEKADRGPLPFFMKVTGPGGGIYNDVAVLDFKTNRIYRLTDVRGGGGGRFRRRHREPPGGTLFPKFSRNGTHIAWGDFVDSKGGKRFGNWRLAVASFSADPEPRLGPVRYFTPGEENDLCEVQGWTPDDRSVYFSCVPLRGQDGHAADICELNIQSGQWKRLTKTSGLRGEPAEFEEHAAISPNGEMLAYMSSRPHGIKLDKNFLTWLKTDLWLARPDGSNARQVTFYNTPGHPDYAGGSRVMVSEMGWHPDSRRLAARVYFVNSQLRRGDDASTIRIFEFAPAMSRR